MDCLWVGDGCGGTYSRASIYLFHGRLHYLWIDNGRIADRLCMEMIDGGMIDEL